MKESHSVEQPLLKWEDLPAFEPAWQPTDLLELRRGDRCPNCGEGLLDYDGQLNLSCPICGFSLGGCFT